MLDFDESVFFPAFKSAGIAVYGFVVPKAGGPGAPGDVVYSRPDTRVIGALSAQHSMEFQTLDFPRLAEGDQVGIAGAGAFVVREAPFVDGYEPTGFFGKALLTLTGHALMREDGGFVLREDGSLMLREAA